MRKYILFLIFLISISSNILGQPISIYCPNFSSTYQGGWQINNNASFVSNYLRLTPNAGGQSGSAFWKTKVSLPSDFSFSTFFTFKITPGSRADGMTFCVQQASNTAGSSGGGLGYSGLPGNSFAIEFDTYNNGEINNNHIAFDYNGCLHNDGCYSKTNGYPYVQAAPMDLADGTMKYCWVDYNGSSGTMEVRISNSSSRPSTAFMTLTSLNLTSNFSSKDVYFGFTAATGGATEEHGVYSSYVINYYNPISSTSSFSQGTASIILSSSNNITCSTTSSTITVTAKDALSNPVVGTLLKVTFDVGGGTLSSNYVTTNSSGQATITYSLATLSSNTIRVTDTTVGAYGTVVITKTGSIPIGGSVSPNSTFYTTTNSGTLNLTGYSGTISKWQKSIDSTVTWTDISNTSTSLTYSNLTSTTMFRAFIDNGACGTATSDPATVVVFLERISGVVTIQSGLATRPQVSLYLVKSSGDSLIQTVTVSTTGSYTLTPSKYYATYKIIPSYLGITDTADFNLIFKESKNVNTPLLTSPGVFLNTGPKMKAGDINKDGVLNIGDAYLFKANSTAFLPYANETFWFLDTDFNSITLSNYNSYLPSNYFIVNFVKSNVTLNLKYIVKGDANLSNSSY